MSVWFIGIYFPDKISLDILVFLNHAQLPLRMAACNIFQLFFGAFKGQNPQVITFGKTEMPTHLQSYPSAFAAHIQPDSIPAHDFSFYHMVQNIKTP
jgi:hypothetical protein